MSDSEEGRIPTPPPFPPTAYTPRSRSVSPQRQDGGSPIPAPPPLPPTVYTPRSGSPQRYDGGSSIPAPPPLPPTVYTPWSGYQPQRSQDDWHVGSKYAEKPPALQRSKSDTHIHHATSVYQPEDFRKKPAEVAAAPPETEEPKMYRSEIVIPITPRPPAPVTSPVPVPGVADITAAMAACVEVHAKACTGPSCSTKPEDIPHVNIQNLVKYFESEIQKETEGADQNRKEYDDLMKYKKVPRWSTSRAPGGAICNVPAIQRRKSSLTPKPLKIKLKPSTERTAEKSTFISKSFPMIPFKGNALSKTTVSEDEHEASKENLVHLVADRADLENQLSYAGRKLVILDFFATWCGPCTLIAPKLDLLAAQHRDRVTFLKVDIESCTTKELVKEYEVIALPTFIFIKNSKKIDGFSGAGSAEGTLKALIAKYS